MNARHPHTPSPTDQPAPSRRPVRFGQPGHEPAPVRERVEDVALVFEGGGMRGAYTAGLVQALLEEGIEFPWVGGISAGSTHTVNMVSRDRWRTREAFVGLTTDPEAGGWGRFARGQGYFNSEYIYQHTARVDEPIPFDFPAFTEAAGHVQVRIGSFRCDTGEEVYWGHEELGSLEALTIRCQASSSMPLLMPQVEIDGAPYLDGAIGPTGGFATDAAQADGFERMLVVSTRPAGYRKPMDHRAAIYRRAFRQLPAVAEALIARTENYNRTISELELAQREGRVYLFHPTRMPIENGELRYDRVVSAYEAGLAQARVEMPRIRGFLGLK